MKQLTLIPKPKREHGGSLAKKKRKTEKPLATGRPIHLVLKSTGEFSLFKHRNFIVKTINRQAELSGVKIYDLSVQHDHIHHSILCNNPAQYKKFVRSATSLLSRKFGRGMWKYRPYTKIIPWGRAFKNLKAYIQQNELEVMGVIPYQKRGKR